MSTNLAKIDNFVMSYLTNNWRNTYLFNAKDPLVSWLQTTNLSFVSISAPFMRISQFYFISEFFYSVHFFGISANLLLMLKLLFGRQTWDTFSQYVPNLILFRRLSLTHKYVSYPSLQVWFPSNFDFDVSDDFRIVFCLEQTKNKSTSLGKRLAMKLHYVWTIMFFRTCESN